MGPRFANVFIEDAAKDRSHTTDFSCIFQCADSLIKLAPCIVTAVATENPVALLSCGINKGTVSLFYLFFLSALSVLGGQLYSLCPAENNFPSLHRRSFWGGATRPLTYRLLLFKLTGLQLR